MTVVQSIKTCLSKYVTFSGRASRSEFWWFAAVAFLIFLTASQIEVSAFPQSVFALTVRHEADSGSALALTLQAGPLTLIAAAIFLIPLTAVGWWRMQDAGLHGLISLAPVFASLATVAILILAAFGSSNAPITIALLVLAIGFFAPIVPALQPYQPGPNKYGPNPHEVTQ